jgi:hypothetical protein
MWLGSDLWESGQSDNQEVTRSSYICSAVAPLSDQSIDFGLKSLRWDLRSISGGEGEFHNTIATRGTCSSLYSSE